MKRFSIFCSRIAIASTDQNCHVEWSSAIASDGAVPTIGPMTGTSSPIIARIASGNANGTRSSIRPRKVAAPIVHDKISCPPNHELMRRDIRLSIRLRSVRTSAGYRRRMKFRNRSASTSMYAIMNSTAIADAMTAAVLRT